ncbi:MAG: site-2 protease family protein, partial [Fibrobacterales bacterium]|nr:site-2 protease family protein [Fibrobacterales bacterium]
WTAVRLGDPTPELDGRLSPNPLNHLDPLGALMLAVLALGGIGLGWAKPVQVEPMNFREPRRDMLLVSLAGPFANLFLATGLLVLFALLGASGVLYALPGEAQRFAADALRAMLSVNVALFAFNMLPIFPLDGHRILPALLPERWGSALEDRLLRWGMRPLAVLFLLEWLTPLRPLAWLMAPASFLAYRAIDLAVAWLPL